MNKKLLAVGGVLLVMAVLLTIAISIALSVNHTSLVNHNHTANTTVNTINLKYFFVGANNIIVLNNSTFTIRQITITESFNGTVQATETYNVMLYPNSTKNFAFPYYWADSCTIIGVI